MAYLQSFDSPLRLHLQLVNFVKWIYRQSPYSWWRYAVRAPTKFQIKFKYFCHIWCLLSVITRVGALQGIHTYSNVRAWTSKAPISLYCYAQHWMSVLLRIFSNESVLLLFATHTQQFEVKRTPIIWSLLSHDFGGAGSLNMRMAKIPSQIVYLYRLSLYWGRRIR